MCVMSFSHSPPHLFFSLQQSPRYVEILQIPAMLLQSLRQCAAQSAVNVLCNSLRLHMARNGVAHVALVTDQAPCQLSAAVAQGYRDAVGAWKTNASNTLVLHEVAFDAATFHTQLADLQSSIAERGSDDRAEELLGCVLVQRGAFQNELKQYRLRLQLFERGLRVAEHAHLGLMSSGEAEMLAYLQSCGYNVDEAESQGRQLSDAIDKLASPATPLMIHSTSSQTSAPNCLTYAGYLETCLMNSGVYPAARSEAANCLQTRRRERQAAQSDKNAGKNATCNRNATVGLSTGGTFPTGEVITEAEDIGALNGTASIFGFPNTSKRMVIACRPFDIEIRQGAIHEIESAAPQEFVDLIGMVKEVEGGEAWIRELGIGLNPFLGKLRPVSDVTAFERQFGVHLSVGKRHPLFPKKSYAPTPERPLRPSTYIRPPLRRKDGVFHIDIFVDATHMTIERQHRTQETPAEVLFRHSFLSQAASN